MPPLMEARSQQEELDLGLHCRCMEGKETLLGANCLDLT